MTHDQIIEWCLKHIDRLDYDFVREDKRRLEECEDRLATEDSLTYLQLAQLLGTYSRIVTKLYRRMPSGRIDLGPIVKALYARRIKMYVTLRDWRSYIDLDTPQDVVDYLLDPRRFISQRQGYADFAEQREWERTNGLPFCGAKAKTTGLLCERVIGGKLALAEWRKKHRKGFCQTHQQSIPAGHLRQRGRVLIDEEEFLDEE